MSDPHARARARLGRMPDAAAWRHIAEAGDLDATVQRMRDNGLNLWVGTLPRSPDVPVIEKTLLQGAISLARDVKRWLAKDGLRTSRWLDQIAQAGDGFDLDRWLRAFSMLRPSASRPGERATERLHHLVETHLQDIREARRRLRQAADPGVLDVDIQWRLREKLAGDMRGLLGGYPFNAGFFLIYAMLELLQFERCRALLVARAHRWDAGGVL
ncbi:MAG: hypothetical protein WAL83_12155 [Arenicellales bacterium]